MGMMVRFAIHRKKKISRVFVVGDERGTMPIPDGWEELVPREIITDDRAFDRWIALDLDARLAALTPAGFKPTRPWLGTFW
jgi:hypothetical protein